jgi:hypothetical protein
LCWKTLDPTPYVISPRAIEVGYLPPTGISALPKFIRQQIPNELRFWTIDNRQQAKNKQAELVKAIKKKTIVLKYPEQWKGSEALANAKFMYHYKSCKGPEIIRAGPSYQEWLLRFNKPLQKKFPTFQLANNLIEQSTTGLLRLDAKFNDCCKQKPMLLKPDTPENPTKATPCWLKALDHGSCTIYEMSDEFFKFNLHGKLLNGLYVASREDPATNIWKVEASDLPQPTNHKLNSIFQHICSDRLTLSTTVDTTNSTTDDTQIGAFVGTAMAPGVWKGWYWSPESIQSLYFLLKDRIPSRTVSIEHDGRKYGFLTAVEFDSSQSILTLKGLLEDTSVLDQFKKQVGLSVNVDFLGDDLTHVVTQVTNLREVSLTEQPACKLCYLESLQKSCG